MNASEKSAELAPVWQRYRPSQALLVSMAVGVALGALFVGNWAAYRSQPQRVAWSDYMQWSQCLALGTLWLIICALTYWFVQLWHEELPTGDDSLDSAWQAGLKRLRARGQRLDQCPLFVVLGSDDRQHQQQLLEQSGLQLIDAIVPAAADAPLAWAMTDQGVWLFIQDAGSYARVSQRLAMRTAETSAFRVTQEASIVARLASEISSNQSAECDMPVAQSPANSVLVSQRNDQLDQRGMHDTTGRLAAAPIAACVLEQATSGEGNSQFKPAMADAASMTGSDSIIDNASMMDSASTPKSMSTTLDNLEELLASENQAKSGSSDPKIVSNPVQTTASGAPWQTALAFASAAEPGVLSSVELTQRQHALQEICRRLRVERGQTAAANGVVAVVRGQQLLMGSAPASELGLALRSDLQILQDTWQLQAPTTLLVDSLETLPGASELVRRGGPERAKVDGLGAGFPIRFQPEKSLIMHLCKLAVAQIEERIYSQLNSSDSLTQVGNHQLFQFLIACRSRLLPGLQCFTSEALGLEYQAQSAREPFLFAGVHFVASGIKATERAWARVALTHVLQAQNFLRWTAARLRAERRLSWTISVLKVCCGIMAIALLVGLCWPTT